MRVDCSVRHARVPWLLLTILLAGGDARAETFDFHVRPHCAPGTFCGHASQQALEDYVCEVVQEMNLQWEPAGFAFRPTVLPVDSSLPTVPPPGLASKQKYWEVSGCGGGDDDSLLRGHWRDGLAAQNPNVITMMLTKGPNRCCSGIPRTFKDETKMFGIYCDGNRSVLSQGGLWAHEMGHHWSLAHTMRCADPGVDGNPGFDADTFVPSVCDGDISIACSSDQQCADAGAGTCVADELPAPGDTPTDPCRFERCGSSNQVCSEDHDKKCSEGCDGVCICHPSRDETIDGMFAEGNVWIGGTRDPRSLDVNWGVTDPLSPHATVCAGGWLQAVNGSPLGTGQTPPLLRNAMSYFGSSCRGPYVIGGQEFVSFSPGQLARIAAARAEIAPRAALPDVCANSGGDADLDGICDDVDGCTVPIHPNRSTRNTCQRDTDGDGIQDACDPCPNDPGPVLDPADDDLDGHPNSCDDDRDGDGCLNDWDDHPSDAVLPVGSRFDANCGLGTETIYGSESNDVDFDGAPNCVDPDDDNDGICDGPEAHGETLPPSPCGGGVAPACYGSCPPTQSCGYETSGICQGGLLDGSTCTLGDASETACENAGGYCPVGCVCGGTVIVTKEGGCTAGPDGCPQAPGEVICHLPGGAPAPCLPSWVECLFGGCVEFFVKFRNLVNPDPTQELVLDQIQMVNRTIYGTALTGMTALQSIGAIQDLAGSGVAGLSSTQSSQARAAGAPRSLLRVELWSRESNELVHVIGDFDPSELAFLEGTRGTILGLVPFDDGRGTKRLEMFTSYAPGVGPDDDPMDADRDGHPDTVDNCTTTPNFFQIDADHDGFGNGCDPDVDGDGIVTSEDVDFIRSCLGVTVGEDDFIAEPETDDSGEPYGGPKEPTPDPEVIRRSARCAPADLNDDGGVDDSDVEHALARLGGPPGPSAVAQAAVPVVTAPQPPPLCAEPIALTKPKVKLLRLGGDPGDEKVVVTAELSVEGGLEALAPTREGAQVLIEDLGTGRRAVYALTADGLPIPPGAKGAGCDPKRDGWTTNKSGSRFVYGNKSARLDPPQCELGGNKGALTLRIKQKKTGAIGIHLVAKNALVEPPTGPLALTIVPGNAAKSLAGLCGSHAFSADDCTWNKKRTKLVCS